jgi:hypothetical protein
VDDVRDRIHRELERLEPSPDGLQRTLQRARRRHRSRRLFSAVLALVVAGAGSFALIRAVAPLNRVAGAGIRVGGTPMAVVDAFDSIWVLTCDQDCGGDGRGAMGRVVRVDPTSRAILASVEIPHPQALAAGEGAVWALDFWGSRVLRIAQDGERLEAAIALELPSDVVSGDHFFAPFDVAVGEGGVWVSTARGQVARIDPATNRVIAMISTPGESTGDLVTGLGLVWVSIGVEGLEAINPGTNTLARGPIEVTRGDRRLQVESLAVGEGIVAMSGAIVSSSSPPAPTDYQPTGQNGVAAFDPASDEVTWGSVEGSGVGIDFTVGRFWVHSADRAELLRVEPLSLRSSGRLDLGGTAYFVAADRVWVVESPGVLRPRDLAISTPIPPATESRLFLSGDGEMWIVGTDSGSVRHLRLPELSPGDPPNRIARRGNKLVLWGYTTYVLDPLADIRPKILVKDSLVFMPSAAPDRIWVGVGTDTSSITALREVSIDGRVTFPDTKPPIPSWPVAALDSGLVFQFPNRRLEVWNPQTGEVVRHLGAGFPVASNRNVLAWCDGVCATLHVTHVDTGEDMEVTPPAGTSGFDRGAFSPDGETIAVAVHTRPVLEGLTTLRSQLALIDVRTGTARLVNGTVVKGTYAFVAWAPSGGAVFITGGNQFEERSIVEYTLGTGTVRRLAVEVGNFYGMAAA